MVCDQSARNESQAGSWPRAAAVCRGTAKRSVAARVAIYLMLACCANASASWLMPGRAGAGRCGLMRCLAAGSKDGAAGL